MKLTFLCEMHREQLESKTAQAIRFWQDGFDTAKFFNEQYLWTDAIPHAGCAFETAEILICKREIETAVAYEWFYASTQLLSDAFSSLGYKEEAYEVMALAVERFDRELAMSHSDQKLVMDYLNKLHWSEHFASSYASLNKEKVTSSGVLVH